VVKIVEPEFVGGSFEVGTNVGVRKTSARALFTGNTKQHASIQEEGLRETT